MTPFTGNSTAAVEYARRTNHDHLLRVEGRRRAGSRAVVRLPSGMARCRSARSPVASACAYRSASGACSR